VIVKLGRVEARVFEDLESGKELWRRHERVVVCRRSRSSHRRFYGPRSRKAALRVDSMARRSLVSVGREVFDCIVRR
jgi:hypothetical protein